MMTGDDPSADAPLASRLRQGDPGALVELFEMHRERLWRMVRFRLDRRIAARIDPDDILQEAFLAASDRIRHFGEQASLSPFLWLRWIVGQTLIDVHRRHIAAEMRDAGRDVSRAAAGSGDATSQCLVAMLAGSFTSPSRAAAGAETSAQLEAAIASMSELDREVIAMRHFEDLTNLEVAEALHISPTAASNRYVRAIVRLKEVLSQFPDFDAWQKTGGG
jgi:RNA polymerase sigma-70 factor, ECF subfamily